MLGGLEIAVIDFKDLNSDLRLDAEYFNREWLNILSDLKCRKTVTINDIAVVTDGIHSSIDYDETSNIRLFSATTPRKNFFDFSRNVFISEKQHICNSRTALRENDIILSTVGTIGNCAVVSKEMLPANADRHVAIIRSGNSFSPHVLSTFLLSKYGQGQMLRDVTGNVQPNLFLYKIREIAVPDFCILFQELVQNFIKTSQRDLLLSNDCYKAANDIINKKLNIDKFANGVFSIKLSSESFGKTGRLDAEYYLPKYDDLYRLLGNLPTETLGNLADIRKSIEPGSEFYCDDGIPFIRVSDVNIFGLEEPAVKLSKKKLSEKICSNYDSLYPKKDTILFSKDGSAGIAYKIDEDTEAITSGALLHLTVKNPGRLLPDYLTLVLNSVAVQMQAERDIGGSVIRHWLPDDIEKVVIPVLSYDIQREISLKVQESFALRKRSKSLVEKAIRAVEIAIEQNEESALQYLKDV